MKTFFSTLLHRLYTANTEHLIWFGAVVAVMITLAVLHHRWKGDEKKIRLWRMLCLIPTVIAAVHAFIYLSNEEFRDKEDHEPEWAVQHPENAYAYDNWIDSVTDGQGVYIGQDKEVVGYYKRIGIAKIDGTYEDMLKLRDMEKRGYLVVSEDGTAFFDLDGEKTEYIFDGGCFYLNDDTDRNDGFRYTCINGRLIINDGTTITQYLRLTDEELAAYTGKK